MAIGMSHADAVRMFDPNAPNSIQPPYATYLPGRRPAWKLHSQRRLAMSALMWVQPGVCGAMFEWNSYTQKWIRVAEHIARDHHEVCDECGGSTQGTDAWNRLSDLGVFVWERERGGKISDPLNLRFVCRACEKFLRP